MFKNYGDITKIDGRNVEFVDCIIGGSPCTSFSQAGKRTGFEGESGLFLHQIRIVNEMRIKSEGKYPRYMILENVLGILTCNNGKDFQRVLMECINVAVRTSNNNKSNQQQYNKNKELLVPDVPLPKGGKWPKSGLLYDEMGKWSIAWRLHDAQYWGVAQRRRRIALVCDFGGLTAPEVLFERKRVSGNTDEGDAQRKRITKNTIRSLEESDKQFGIWDARGNGDGKLANTITGNHDNRITDYSHWEETSRTLDCVSCYFPTDNQGSKSVVEPIPLEGNGARKSHRGSGFGSSGSPSFTLNTVEKHCVCLAESSIHPITIERADNNQEQNNKYEHQIKEAEIMPTLKASDYHAVSVPVRYRIRRLTPLECTRLQGFPDGWVDIGDWFDSKGKKHKESDAPKYRALGNSIALPFWKWLCKNIVNQIRKTGNEFPTMASLFAGIGGFDICWLEATELKDSILWVSEIEEFPIAVLKYHFS